MSYLLTYSGKAVQEFHKTHAKARRYTQCVVRWGANWGFIQPSPNWDTAWQAEQRAPVADHEQGDEKFLLERITPLPQQQAPPLAIDDMWSEEVCFDRHIKAGNLLYIRGTMSDIQATLKQLNIFTPPWLQAQQQAHPPSPMKEREQEPPQYRMTPPQKPPQLSQAPQLQAQQQQQQQQGRPQQREKQRALPQGQRAFQTPLRRAPTSTGGTTSSRPPLPSSQHRPPHPSPSSRPLPSPAQSNRLTQSRSQGTPHQQNQSQQTSAQRVQTSQ